MKSAQMLLAILRGQRSYRDAAGAYFRIRLFGANFLQVSGDVDCDRLIPARLPPFRSRHLEDSLKICAALGTSYLFAASAYDAIKKKPAPSANELRSGVFYSRGLHAP